MDWFGVVSDFRPFSCKIWHFLNPELNFPFLRKETSKKIFLEIFRGNISCGYLVGSMHVGSSSTDSIVNLTMPYLNRMDTLLMEFDLSEAIPGEVTNRLVLSERNKISNQIPRVKYNRIRNRLLRFASIDISDFDKMPPFYLISQIYNSFLPEQAGIPMDIQFYLNARETGKSVIGIETMESQAEILSSIPMDIQMRALDDFSRRFDRHRKAFLKSVELYGKSSAHHLYQLNKKQMGPVRRQLIYERNFKMADAIDLNLQHCRAMVVVGVGHLSGQFGLIRLLKRCGYRLKVIA
ncbi:MAG: TraB/GumN family protein [Saprospirales bacterium]|nr:MAG: TraB/GumN family protein [Saprospirales bacterium]